MGERMGQAAAIIGSPSADDPPARRTFSRRLLPLHTTPVLRVETGTVELRYLELAVGGDPSDLSYGNTIKRSADIAYAFECGVRQFTVDSPGELIKVMTLAPGATVLVRITTNGAGADWALGRKFGCPENEAAALLGESPAIGDYGAAIAARSVGTWGNTRRR